ncbi:hypothetical protein RRG08_013366 [Elysia crispata]|uniref:Uncharacterized protein n=1 Tax=Elysia crispata TaxID=231223 RepID=A0AAE1D3J0_9GAST|nr:hypothetical protein RRG08_013366 [Elysia crispata]
MDRANLTIPATNQSHHSSNERFILITLGGWTEQTLPSLQQINHITALTNALFELERGCFVGRPPSTGSSFIGSSATPAIARYHPLYTSTHLP